MSTLLEAALNNSTGKLPEGWLRPSARPPAARKSDRFAAFYKSRAWRAARYKFLREQPRPLRCSCCGATAADTRLAVDHIVPIKRDWSRRSDQSNFQILCAVDCNLAKGSHDQTDWRTAA
jgi:5-methylcytosine-specific restriction endonuclease McrA